MAASRQLVKTCRGRTGELHADQLICSCKQQTSFLPKTEMELIGEMLGVSELRGKLSSQASESTRRLEAPGSPEARLQEKSLWEAALVPTTSFHQIQVPGERSRLAWLDPIHRVEQGELAL